VKPFCEDFMVSPCAQGPWADKYCLRERKVRAMPTTLKNLVKGSLSEGLASERRH
jgi:hypothetical protein